MDYEYTKTNRIQHPHNYMYSEYFGADFIDVYLQNRLKFLTLINNKTENSTGPHNLFFFNKAELLFNKHLTNYFIKFADKGLNF